MYIFNKLNEFIGIYLPILLVQFLIAMFKKLLKHNEPYQGPIQRFFGTPFFEMVIFPYQHHGSLGVRKLQVFNTSDTLKTYSTESNM